MKTPTPPRCTEEGLPDVGPFTEECIARIAKGLAHPERVRILEEFEECRPHIAHEIVCGSELAQSTVSEHLRILREAGILFARKDGPRTWYCMRRSVLREFARAVEELTTERTPAQTR